MALIDCPECTGKISDKALTCVHCGYPLNLKDAVGDCIPPTENETDYSKAPNLVSDIKF